MSDRSTRFLEPNHIDTQAIAPAMLAWYDRHARVLPWRARPGEKSDPYHVWLSEIMLQQTTVATVGTYFHRFLTKWPTVHDLAKAELDDVLTEWAGLGYYARARNLHKCARTISAEQDGRFPDTVDALEELPGIGRYTAAAIAAIAFGRSVPVMDGNIERVMARLFSVATPLPQAKPALWESTKSVTPSERAGDFAQALMDLGAGICTPGRPKCTICPLVEHCTGRDIAETLPRKQPKKKKPVRRATAIWIRNRDGEVLLRRRAESGLLGGMMEIPSTEWVSRDDYPSAEEAIRVMPISAELTARLGEITHTFTHFRLELSIHAAACYGPTEELPLDCRWVATDRLDTVALPTVMQKIVKTALTP